MAKCVCSYYQGDWHGDSDKELRAMNPFDRKWLGTWWIILCSIESIRVKDNSSHNNWLARKLRKR